MLRKVRGFVAIQMRDASAVDALLMEVMVTVAAVTDILVYAAFLFFTLESAHHLILTKRCHVAIDAAFSCLTVAVHLLAELLNGELSVGMLAQK